MGNSPDGKHRLVHVLKFILENCDEEYPAFSATDIQAELSAEEININADRRAIYTDIAAIRDVLGLDIEGTPSGKFRLKTRPFQYDDLCMIAECIYAAKFISDDHARRLIETLGRFASNPQADKLMEEVFLCQRVKTGQKDVLAVIRDLRKAIKEKKKIQFKYLHREIDDVTKEVVRNRGKRFTVSPYKLMISDGNYYLLAYSEQARDMRLFRVDKIQKVEILQILRTGQPVFDQMDLSTYTKRVFFMNPGDQQKVSLRFERKLLDSVVERLGAEGDIIYRPDGPDHFVVNADIEISNQFFGWLSSFGAKAKIMYPQSLAEEYTAHLQEIIQQHQE